MTTLTCQVGQEDARDDHQLHTGAQEPPHFRVGDLGDVDLRAVQGRAVGPGGPSLQAGVRAFLTPPLLPT